MCTGVIISIHQLLHPSVQTDITAKVKQHTIEPVMLAETFLPIPHRLRITPLRKFLTIQIQYQQITGIECVDHRFPRIRLPCLHHPHSLRIRFLHSTHNRSSRLCQVYSFRISSFVKGVHTVILCFSVQFLQLLIIHGSK